MRWSMGGFWLVGLLVFPALVKADTLYLKDGRIVRGEIVSETEEVVSVKEPVGTSGYAQARYVKTQIERIERTAVTAQPATTTPGAGSASVGETPQQIVTKALGSAAATIQQGAADTRVRAAVADIKGNLKVALRIYQADNGAFPTTEQSLQALLTKPAAAKRWRGPYVDAPPRDPWGRPYRYVCPGQHGAFDLFSVGPDGQEGTADDVTNW